MRDDTGMAWVDTVATSLTGIAGILATYFASGRQHKAGLQLAREERLQRRLEAAYMELLAYLSHTYQWALSVYPLFTNSPQEYTMPPMPPLPDPARTEALLTAYWSPRVQQLMQGWREVLGEIADTGTEIHTAQEAQSRGEEYPGAADAKKRLRRLKDQLWQSDQSIREQVRLELRGEHDGSLET